MPVVHCKKDRYDVYIGRNTKDPMHYGNPFTHKQGTVASVIVSSREEAVARYESWLKGETDNDLDQERRQWILDHLSQLKGKTLGCWCAPLACHGDVLERMSSEAF